MMSPEIWETFPLLSLGTDKLLDFKQSQEFAFRRKTKAIFGKTPLEPFPQVSTHAQSSYATPV
jgi:hypothetical protein